MLLSSSIKTPLLLTYVWFLAENFYKNINSIQHKLALVYLNQQSLKITVRLTAPCSFGVLKIN